MVCTTLHPRCLPNENAILLDVGIGSRLVFESKAFWVQILSQPLRFPKPHVFSPNTYFGSRPVYWNMNFLIGTDPLGPQQWEKLGGWGVLHEERTIFLTFIIQAIVNALAKHQCHPVAGQDIEGRWVRNALRNRVASFICRGFCRVLGHFHPKWYKIWLHESYVLGGCYGMWVPASWWPG